MNVEYIIRFKGIAPKAVDALDRMVQEELASYPGRLSMAGATVERIEPALKSMKPGRSKESRDAAAGRMRALNKKRKAERDAAAQTERKW